MRIGAPRLRPVLASCLALTSVLTLAAPLVAENRLSIRGAYFREASTRVVQPMLEISKDLPGGYEVVASTLVDAISSASIAQGAATDEVFTEKRYEGSLAVARTMGLLKVGVFGRVSREPDYHSLTGGLSLSREVWERTGILSVSAAATHDDILPIMRSEKELDTLFAGVTYSQVLSPTSVAQASWELFYNRGFLANPYLRSGNYGEEKVPDRRLRHALAARAAHYFPDPTFGLQLSYRFYFDHESFTSIGPWGMTAHTIEARVFKNLGSDVEVRLGYRFHWQGAARFWCNERVDFGGVSDCYGLEPEYHALDYKFGSYTTHLPELKVTWELRVLTGTALGFLASGALDASYGFYLQNSPYGMRFDDVTAPPVLGNVPGTREGGGAHLIQTGYSLPF